jgi:hypothetical protein
MTERLRPLNWIFLFLTVLELGLLGLRAEELDLRLSDVGVNETPPGFASVLGGKGRPAEWKMILDEVTPPIPAITANAPVAKKPVLAQLSRDVTDEHFPMLVYTNMDFADFKFTTRFKCAGGAIEQMAGVVFRFQNASNYYYLRASAKGNTFRFTKVVNDQRPDPIGPEIEIPSGVWHDLSVECKGNQILCSFNGKQVIPALTDDSFSNGKIGFWTKSDSVSYFSDAHITYKPREPFGKVLIRDVYQKYPRVLSLRLYAVPPGKKELEVIASTRENEIGQPGTGAEKMAMEKNSPLFGHPKGIFIVTMPVHDKNGEAIAALRIELKSFLGQTENNALGRALPIVQDMERRLVASKALF